MAHMNGTDNSEVSRIGEGGRIVIPARFRHTLKLKEGDPVLLLLEEGCIKVSSRGQAIRQAQDLVTRRISRKISLAKGLLADRRREASRE